MAQIEINGVQYPSFDTLAEVDAYLAADIARADAWEALDEPMRKRAIVSAARLLMRQVWCDGVPDIVAAPDVVKAAQAIIAADIAAKPKLADGVTAASNIKRAKAGSAEVEYFKPTEAGAPFSQVAWGMLVAAGLLGCAAAVDSLPDDGPFVSNGVRECGDEWRYGCRPFLGRYACDYL